MIAQTLHFHLFSIVLAYLIDLLIGDPKWLPHPVRMMGSLIHVMEKGLNRGRVRKLKGLLFLALFLSCILVISLFLIKISYQLHWVFGFCVESLLIATTIATKGLKEAALEVYQPLVKGDLKEARYKLSWIVGRDTEDLPEDEIVRGTIETVAENTSDGIIAPLFWALIGGAPLALLYRSVNTCDSMVGYKNERFLHFGWASARFDDLLNLIPSRITGLLMILVNRPQLKRSKKACFQVIRRDARKHPSPNSGYGEAAAASLLGVQLGGINRYQGVESVRETMGDLLQPLQKEHIVAVTQTMERTVAFFILICLLGGICFAVSESWGESFWFL